MLAEELYTKRKNISAYQPPQDIANFTKVAQECYAKGWEILHKPWIELNDYSPIERDNMDGRTFNAFVDESIEDPAEAWKWRGTRSKARNKGIVMHANLTGAYLLPLFDAQNKEDELDRGISEIMRDVVEWMTQPAVSDYQSAYFAVTQGMLTNSVTYLGAEYLQIYQTIKSKQEDGSYKKEEILDEVLSGFKCPVYSTSEVLIQNAYVRNIQRQSKVIKRKWIDYHEAESKYGEHENWGFVQPGFKSIFNAEDGLFYDVKDEEHPALVEEIIIECRKEDYGIPLLGGIYLGDSSLEGNPIKHRDNKGAPKYNIVPFGYHRIGEHFYFYKSLMNGLGWDNGLYDAMTELVMNRAILEVEMPTMISGSDEVDSDIVFPSSVVAFKDKDVRVTPLLPPANLLAGFRALDDTADSMSEGSVNETQMGQLPEASQKAYSVAQAQANAKKIIRGVGKTLGESVMQYGLLMADIAINHLTIPQIDEITGDNLKTKYPQFVLVNKNIGGKMVNKRIRFDESLIGREYTQKEVDEMSLDLLTEAKYPEHKELLYRVNPYLFSKMKYLCRIDVEEMFPKNDEYWQGLLTNLFGILRNDPYISQEGIRRKLLYSYFKSEGEELLEKNPQAGMQQGLTPAMGDQFGRQSQQKQLVSPLGVM